MEQLRIFLDFIGDMPYDVIASNCEFDVKDNDDLYMLHYNESNDILNPMVRVANGIILEKNTNKLVHYAFSKPYDGIAGIHSCGDLYPKRLERYKMQPYIEGTLIKVFYHDGSWRIGTSRNIDAVYSHWGSEKSFKELFLETCSKPEVNIDLDSLDKDYCYSYILQHPEITIGYDITVDFIIQVNKINRKTLEETDFMNVYDSEFTILTAPRDRDFYVITEDNERIKNLSSKYKTAQELLNNNPSIECSYIDSIKSNRYNEFRSYWPSKKHKFDYIDSMFTKIVDILYSIYYIKFIEKKKIDVEKKYRNTIYNIHGLFKETKQKTTKMVIAGLILDSDTSDIYHLLDL